MNVQKAIRSALLAALFSLAALPARADDPPSKETGELSWYKGNTHTHTLWSDGDAAPEVAADWYKAHGYDFLVLSDHNILSEGERWVPVGEEKKDRVRPGELARLAERFGSEWVETREVERRREMRLKTLAELRAAFEEPGRFLFLQGEEISDRFDGRPIHLGAVNIERLIRPQGGSSVQDVIRRNLEATMREAERSGRPALVHVNHPNFVWAVTPDDIAQVLEERFFEVHNGHPKVHNEGDEHHPGMEETWDHVLAQRLGVLGGEPLYGLATDDAHNYFADGPQRSNPGRGWIMVRAAALSADDLIRALRAGDFYASSGVDLEDVVAGPESLTVKIATRPGVSYVTRFVGTRLVDGKIGKEGEILAESRDARAAYRFAGDELYVRAVVVSDRRRPNGYPGDDIEKAWVQPVVISRAGK
ncbi:MAG: histidinol-phosphatase [Planctomycetes bacterium]|nr:histidinol-phosphatase [Planctomycetota bacterium]